MIIVTGGAGFIGSNLIHALNAQNRSDILVVDDLSDGKKMHNLATARIADYIDKDIFIERVRNNVEFPFLIDAVFHLGACSDTTEWDGKFIMENNYEYSKSLLHFCLERRIPFIYASSASVYGSGQQFKEELAHELPINMYAYSKFLFDQYTRPLLQKSSSPIVGLRYFNVYGPREQHKGKMASVVWHHYQQLQQNDSVQLFSGSDGYADGEQRRDFIYVDDVVKVNLWFYEHRDFSGIFNVGTGSAQTFNTLAQQVIANVGKGHIKYIPFPQHLVGSYQSFTQADMSQLRSTGYQAPFTPIEEGVKRYVQWLNSASFAALAPSFQKTPSNQYSFAMRHESRFLSVDNLHKSDIYHGPILHKGVSKMVTTATEWEYVQYAADYITKQQTTLNLLGYDIGANKDRALAQRKQQVNAALIQAMHAQHAYDNVAWWQPFAWFQHYKARSAARAYLGQQVEQFRQTVVQYFIATVQANGDTIDEVSDVKGVEKSPRSDSFENLDFRARYQNIFDELEGLHTMLPESPLKHYCAALKHLRRANLSTKTASTSGRTAEINTYVKMAESELNQLKTAQIPAFLRSEQQLCQTLWEFDRYEMPEFATVTHPQYVSEEALQRMRQKLAPYREKHPFAMARLFPDYVTVEEALIRHHAKDTELLQQLAQHAVRGNIIAQTHLGRLASAYIMRGIESSTNIEDPTDGYETIFKIAPPNTCLGWLKRSATSFGNYDAILEIKKIRSQGENLIRGLLRCGAQRDSATFEQLCDLLMLPKAEAKADLTQVIDRIREQFMGEEPMHLIQKKILRLCEQDVMKSAAVQSMVRWWFDVERSVANDYFVQREEQQRLLRRISASTIATESQDADSSCLASLTSPFNDFIAWLKEKCLGIVPKSLHPTQSRNDAKIRNAPQAAKAL